MLPLQLFILSFFGVLGKDLIYSFDATNQNMDYWVTVNNGGFTLCGSQRILSFGSYTGSAAMTYIGLPPHYKIYVEFTFYRIDFWDSDLFQIFQDYQLIYQEIFTSSQGSQICGDTNNDEIKQIKLTFEHTSNIVGINLQTIDLNIDSQTKWGLSQFALSIEPCPYGCQYCEQNLLWRQCKQWTISYWDKSYNDYYYFNSNNLLYRILRLLSYQRTYSQILPQHTKVIIRFRAFVAQNMIIQITIDNSIIVKQNFIYTLYQWTTLEFTSHPIIHSSRSITVSIQQTSNHGFRFYIKDFQILIFKEDYQPSLVHSGCSNIIKGGCFDCDIGWEFDALNFKCIPICGDKVIVGYEECDDDNDIQNDGCHQCKFSCPKYCISCLFGICQSCFEGYYLDINNIGLQICRDGIIEPYLESRINNVPNHEDFCSNYMTQCSQKSSHCDLHFCTECNQGFELNEDLCNPICGDQIIVGCEECDDGNDVQNDGCHQCQFSCVLQCSSCLFGICQSCLEGYYLDPDNNCLPICGDEILIPYLEQCDGNNYEICSNCWIECQEYCSYCNSAVCFKCDDGFVLYQDQCSPVCGDKIIISEFEECDDGNDLPYDGCFDCQYECSLNCNLCKQGICLDQCPYGQVMVNNICQSECGNRIVTGYEECDDGNSIQYDGCHQCLYSCPLFCENCEAGQCLECLENYYQVDKICKQIYMNEEIEGQGKCDDENSSPNDGCYNFQVELNWICNSVIPSECAFSSAPKMIVSYLNQTFSIQYIEITFNQKVAIISDIPLALSIQASVSEVSDQLQNITIYSIQQATTDLSFARYCLSVEIKQLMSERPILEIDLNQDVVNSLGISVTNQNEQIILNLPKYLAPNLKQTAESLLNFNQNIIIGLGGISILTLVMGNTGIFTEILNILQYISYLKYINLNYPENLFLFFQISDMVSIAPLLQNIGLDKYFNQMAFQGEITSSQGKFSIYQVNTDLITNLSCQFLQCLGLVTFILCIKIFQGFLFSKLLISKYLYYMGLLASQTSCTAIFLLKEKFYKKIRVILTTSSVWVLIGLRRIFLVNSWDLLFKTFLFISSMQLNSIRNYFQVSLSMLAIITYLIIILFCLTPKTLFGLRAGLEQNQVYFEIITLCRQILFLALLVFFQDDQVMQTLLINGINLGYFVILQVNKKIKCHTNFIQQIIEGSILLFTMSSAVYFEDFKVYIDEKHKINYGFAHIAMLCFALIVSVINFFFIKGRTLFTFISLKLKELKKKEYPQAPINPTGMI